MNLIPVPCAHCSATTYADRGYVLGDPTRVALSWCTGCARARHGVGVVDRALVPRGAPMPADIEQRRTREAAAEHAALRWSTVDGKKYAYLRVLESGDGSGRLGGDAARLVALLGADARVVYAAALDTVNDACIETLTVRFPGGYALWRNGKAQHAWVKTAEGLRRYGIRELLAMMKGAMTV